MCEKLQLIRAGREALDEMLARIDRVPIQKAMNLGSPRGFDSAVGSMAAELRRKAKSSDLAAVRAAVEVLDVDWHRSTAEQRRALIQKAMKAAGRKTRVIPDRLELTFGRAADDVVAAARLHARERLNIPVDFNKTDERIIKHLKTSQSYFINDEYGKRLEGLSGEVSDIVARGLEQGLGRDDISGMISDAASRQLVLRSQPYWDVVAGAFVGRGRSFGQLSACAEARIERYQIEAVLDEATTNICRFMHGKVFTVEHGLGVFEQVEKSPERIKDLNPWIREGVDEDGRPTLYVKRAGRRSLIATVEQSGVGEKDDLGRYSRTRSEQGLMGLGISVPPLHGMCRSSLVVAK